MASRSSDRDALLRVQGLNAWYGELHILHGIDFEVRKGELVTLLGRNGAGKTTTLKSIIGIVRRRTGSIRLRGEELIDLPSRAIAWKGVGYVPEERGIFASLTVEENLLLPPVGAAGRHDDRAIYELFPNLLLRRGSQGTKLSGGRAANAGDGAHPAHRRTLSAAGRADRGSRACDRGADRRTDRAPESAGVYDRAG